MRSKIEFKTRDARWRDNPCSRSLPTRYGIAKIVRLTVDRRFNHASTDNLRLKRECGRLYFA
jgi:hypothetical protein